MILVMLAGGAENVKVMSEQECCTSSKPVPMLISKVGQRYSPVQAAGHVFGSEKKSSG